MFDFISHAYVVWSRGCFLLFSLQSFYVVIVLKNVIIGDKV